MPFDIDIKPACIVTTKLISCLTEIFGSAMLILLLLHHVCLKPPFYTANYSEILPNRRPPRSRHQRFFAGGLPARSSPGVLRFVPKPNATFVRSPLAGTGVANVAGVPRLDPGAGDDSLTILENPDLGAGDPTLTVTGAGDADADPDRGVKLDWTVGKAVKAVISTICGAAVLFSFFFLPFFSALTPFVSGCESRNSLICGTAHFSNKQYERSETHTLYYQPKAPCVPDRSSPDGTGRLCRGICD
jgi:hypothetical protein